MTGLFYTDGDYVGDEADHGTNPEDSDTDDGLSDYGEIYNYRTYGYA